ncbi:hypothetical protein LI951_14995 [Enterococcus sp. BWT-B8]|uniref:hypothetical protein n=1 Tax=Enterococcus sp. BWT-B8 TaxID=2885157 RepID=UPI001E584368|nr:hypothetical protein [Enterococcus sp. BWT-B8]MCB5953363.1 hypothetical protein [Enterococcus sp. BWT-B8]
MHASMTRTSTLKSNWGIIAVSIIFTASVISVDLSSEVSKTLTCGKNNRLIINHPKTKAGLRTILIDKILTNALIEYRSTQRKIINIASSSSFIFSDDIGMLISLLILLFESFIENG